jgi:hypothetical protein
MTGLLGPNGKPISSAQFVNKKAAPPKLGAAFGDWAGRDQSLVELPGGGIVQFDLSKLTIADYRAMRDHYQVNASLAVLSFMQHQSDWHIECEDQKIATAAEEFLRTIWTQLNRGLGQANWAGYSPNILDWENDVDNRRIVVNKVKDLNPEECAVNWKLVEGWAPPEHVKPKFKIYDGIRYTGSRWPVPVENTLWYPLLMENGDYGGRKLLRPAFTSWFFSILVHLFANRYYERFGEPTPIGRAPFEEEIEQGGTSRPGNEFMLDILQQLRSRSVVVLPNDKSPVGSNNSMEYDYDIEYLESQMRGADFERYMTRLDEEISIGLFTPILLLRTADVGSYNLGQGHERIYQVMLNAMNDDRAQYIDRYILRKYVNYNFSEKAPNAKIKFQKLGVANQELIKEIVTILLGQNKAKVDLREIGSMTGMTLTEVEQTLAESEPVNPDADPAAPDNPSDRAPEARSVAKEIYNRVRPQIENALQDGSYGPHMQVNMGFKRKMERALSRDGVTAADQKVNDFFNRMDYWIKDCASVSVDSTDEYMQWFGRTLDTEIDRLVR